MFAFSDKSVKPRIFVLSYPSFEKIAVLEDNDTIVKLALNETEYLVSLSGTPKFEFTLWSWRYSKKLCSTKSSVRSENTPIRFFLHSQTTLIGISKHQTGSNKLFYLEILYCNKEYSLLKREFTSSKPIVISSYCFSREGNIHVIDKYGNIYFASKDTLEIEPLISVNPIQPKINMKLQECNYYLTWFKGGLLVTTPETYFQHYKRNQDYKWSVSWKIEVPSTISTARLINEFVIAFTTNGELLKITSRDCVEHLHFYGGHYKFVTIVYPKEVLATTSGIYFNVFNFHKGDFIGSIVLDDESLSMDCHPFKPLVAVGLVNGSITIVGINKFKSTPKVLANLYLCNDEIDHIYFERSGRVFVAAACKTGKIFVLKGLYGEDTQVLHYLEIKEVVLRIKYCYNDSKSGKSSISPEIIILIQSNPHNPFAGNDLLFLTISLKIIRKITLESNIVDFEPLGEGRFKIVVQGSSHLYTLNYNFEQDEVVSFTDYVSGHGVRKFNISGDENHYYTYGWAGVVVLYSVATENMIGRVLALHCLNHGIQDVAMSLSGRYLVVIGIDSTLVCYKILGLSEYAETNIISQEDSDDDILGFQMLSIFPIDGSQQNTWLKYEEDKKIALEQKKYENKTKLIKQTFEDIKIRLVKLLNENLMLPEDEQIEISEFELDTKREQNKTRAGEIERAQVKEGYEKIIHDCDTMSELIIEQFWNKMSNKTRLIKAISGSFSVQSFGQVPMSQELLDSNRWKDKLALFQSKFVSSSTSDVFYPWEPVKPSVAESGEKEVADATNLTDNGDKSNVVDTSDDTEELDENLKFLRKYEYSGTASYKYVNIPPELQVQMVHLSRFRSYTDSYIFDIVQVELQNYFNKKFDEMFKRKEYEVQSVIQRNNRLRVILYEMEASCKRPPLESPPVDPQWSFEEIPENLVTVQNYEVKAKPYISPSEQRLIDERLAEEERIRRLLAADNFRELALIEMMDGVLEIRWEDELKKDIPPPACMEEKEPENFNEQDLIAIRDYEEKVKFHNSERDRYYKMLEQEYYNIKKSIEDSIKKFDDDLYDLLLLKLNVESALNQEILKKLRLRKLFFDILKLDFTEIEIRRNSKQRELDANSLNSYFEKIKEGSRECKAYHESLLAKDKYFERHLKKELNNRNVSATVIDNLLKLFKRRPKLQQHLPACHSLLDDLSQCILPSDPEVIKKFRLPDEYKEFLKNLIIFDDRQSFGSHVGVKIWDTFVNWRRKKIESEFKIRASEIAVKEAEKTVNKFSKEIMKDSKGYTKAVAQEKINSIREEKLKMLHDFELQLIMKEGQVELNITGQRQDFNDCILINRSVIDHINSLVKDAGRKKIEAMYACADFHRIIILKEWEHKKLRMEIDDLKTKMHLIESTKVTSDVKIYLKRVAKNGEPTMKELISVDKDSTQLKMLDLYYKKAVQEITEQVRTVEMKLELAKKENDTIDKKVEFLNIETSTIHRHRDIAYEKSEKDDDQKRMDLIVTRSNLVKKIHDTHREILQLQTELEILRLKTYPTLKYKSLI
ncbi:cilia- and flagella-associated protein 43 isoform X2 [Lycorma delicatula]